MCNCLFIIKHGLEIREFINTELIYSGANEVRKTN